MSLADTKVKDQARAAFMKKNPGQFPDSISQRLGWMRGCKHDGTHDAKRMAVTLKGADKAKKRA